MAMAHPCGYCSHLSPFLSFTGWGCKSDKPILLHPPPPPPPGSPVSSERPVDSWRGGVEGSWTLPVAWLAADVGVVVGVGGDPTPLG